MGNIRAKRLAVINLWLSKKEEKRIERNGRVENQTATRCKRTECSQTIGERSRMTAYFIDYEVNSEGHILRNRSALVEMNNAEGGKEEGLMIRRRVEDELEFIYA